MPLLNALRKEGLVKFISNTEQEATQLRLVPKKRQPTRLVNVAGFASTRFCKQYFVTATFTSKPVIVY